MHPLKSIFKLFLLTILVGTSGCIHTYPSPEETIDPTEIEMVVVLHFNEEWNDKVYTQTASEVSRASAHPRRIYIEITGRSGKPRSYTKIIQPEEISDGIYRLELPSKVKADTYSLAVWCDCLNPTTLEPVAYDISNPYLIKELVARGEESDRRMCLTGRQEIDLRPRSGKWNVTAETEITLSTPMARFRLVADDYQEFLRQTEDARKKGEKYYVTVNYISDIPGGFSLINGKPMDPVSGARFSGALPILLYPGIEVSIGSDWLFNTSGEYPHTVTVTVFNSAQVMVSRTSGITFPMRCGHITTVKGKLLTNFISGGIQIDNLWAGEIIIELD